MDSKAHAVCIPAPFQSHIKAMLNLSKLLQHKGFQITFINTDFNHNRLIKSRGQNALDGSSDFQFESISDNLPPSDADQSQDPMLLLEPIRNYMLTPFLDLLEKLNRRGNPVTCIVADNIMIFTYTAARQLGIPIVSFVPISACSFLGIQHSRRLIEEGFTPLKDESYLTNGYLDTVVDWIEGMKGIRLRDFPSYIRTTNPKDVLFDFVMEIVEKVNEASAVMFHTLEALESQVLKTLSSMLTPPIYVIGPLQLHLREIADDRLKMMESNLWKEEPKGLEWLDSKEPNSVLYVNFGSIAIMTKEQLVELAMGLANSNQYFLWIIRPDLVRGESSIFPPEFMEKTKERGFIASWCAQEAVLNHKSVGGFLTHCGWNSILESVSAGVAMLCRPFYDDQPTNCRYTCVEWEMGLELTGDGKRDEVEKLVIELMEGEKGKKLKAKAMECKKMADMATSSNGSSFVNLDKVAKEVLLWNY